MMKIANLHYTEPLYTTTPGIDAQAGDLIDCPICEGEGCLYCHWLGFIMLDERLGYLG